MKKTITYFAGFLLLVSLTACSTEKKQDSNHSDKEKSGQQVATSPAKPANVGIDRFEELIQESGMQILDVRTPSEVAEGVVEGSTHINIHDSDFKGKVTSQLDKSKPVVVYCLSGGRSANAASKLSDMGFTNIFNYTGGMSEWKAKGKNLVK